MHQIDPANPDLAASSQSANQRIRLELRHWLLLSLAVLAFACPTIQAELATAQQMETVCSNWLTSRVASQGTWAGSFTQVRILHTMATMKTATAT